MFIWRDVFLKEKKLSYFNKMLSFLAQQRSIGVLIHPPSHEVFNAFYLTKLNTVKVVILGQDPYYRPKQAHGLSFSVKPGISIPPSLINIYKEIENDIPEFIFPKHGCLQSWAKQGILLLNTILTVESGKAHSHANIGWEIFTNKIIKLISDNHKGIVFLLWGVNAQKKSTIIDHNRHYILKASHPSPLSAHLGFFGCRHFSKTNRILIQQGKNPINWEPILPKDV